MLYGKTFFDFEDGDFAHSISDNMAIDSDGDLLMRTGDNMAMDMDSGELHIISAPPVKFCVNNNPSSNNKTADCGVIKLVFCPQILSITGSK